MGCWPNKRLEIILIILEQTQCVLLNIWMYPCDPCSCDLFYERKITSHLPNEEIVKIN